MNAKICFVGGKSAGHIVPLLTLAQEKKKLNSSNEIFFIADTTALDKNLIESAPYINNYCFIRCSISNCSAIKYYFSLIFLYCIAFVKSLRYLQKHRPNKIISSGGALSVPVCFAAWILRIPITLYELNAVPGKASRIIGYGATTINVCFKNAIRYFKKNKVHLTPYPLQEELRAPSTTSKSSEKITILIAGGSQGSQFLNSAMQRLFETYPALIEKITVIHQTGSDPQQLQQWYKSRGIDAHVFSFDSNFRRFYKQVDLVIARAGSGTLHEILSSKTEAIIVPLETTTTNHQRDNAQAMVIEYPHQFSIIRQRDLTDSVKPLYDLIMKQFVE